MDTDDANVVDQRDPDDIRELRAALATTQARLDGLAQYAQMLRRVLEELLCDYQDIVYDNDTKLKLFVDPAIAALSAQPPPACDLLEAARRYCADYVAGDCGDKPFEAMLVAFRKENIG